jgi:hypothetical protein
MARYMFILLLHWMHHISSQRTTHGACEDGHAGSSVCLGEADQRSGKPVVRRNRVSVGRELPLGEVYQQQQARAISAT